MLFIRTESPCFLKFRAERHTTDDCISQRGCRQRKPGRLVAGSASHRLLKRSETLLQSLDVGRRQTGRRIPAEPLHAVAQFRDGLVGRVGSRGNLITALVERRQCNAERFHGIVGRRQPFGNARIARRGFCNGGFDFGKTLVERRNRSRTLHRQDWRGGQAQVPRARLRGTQVRRSSHRQVPRKTSDVLRSNSIALRRCSPGFQPQAPAPPWKDVHRAAAVRLHEHHGPGDDAETSVAVRSMVGAGLLRRRAPSAGSGVVRLSDMRASFNESAQPRQTGNNAIGLCTPTIKPAEPAKARSKPASSGRAATAMRLAPASGSATCADKTKMSHILRRTGDT